MALGAMMGPIEVDDYILDAQLVKNCQLERSIKLTVSALLLGLSSLKELSVQIGVPLGELDRSHILKYHAGITLTKEDIERARAQADKKLNSRLSPTTNCT
jgi:hypothetical protein